MPNDPIVIVSATRTPIGNLLGAFKDVPAPVLGTTAIKGALSRSGLQPADIQEVIMGCVLTAGQGQAPARQAAIDASIPYQVGATTVNKMCGSGMKAVMLAHDALKVGNHDIILAGGMESMSNAPYLMPKARSGYRLGHQQVLDHMFYDGLEDAYEKGKLMGCFAEDTASYYKFSRELQDQFAIESLKRAKKAADTHCFDAEITPVQIQDRYAEILINTDENPTKANLEKIPQLKPAFKKDGTVTAANSSSISDGAAALILMKKSVAEKKGLTPLATIVAHTTHAREPHWFTTAPIGAIQQLLEKTSWKLKDVDLFEINEAFAVVTLATMRELDIPHDKVNVHGGACALGHPIGASGARVIVTLLHALRQYHLKRGIATVCIGGGEATAIAIECY